MRRTYFLLTVLTSLALSTPVVDKHGASFVIPIIRRQDALSPIFDSFPLLQELYYTMSKYNQGFEAYYRNTGCHHPLDRNQRQMRAKRTSTSVSLAQDTRKSLWQGTVSAGTPPIHFLVDFDTGSSEMFLPGSNCTVNCQGHNLYNPESSSTCRPLNEPFALSFGDKSSVSGDVYEDTVTVGTLTAQQQTIGVASWFSDDYRPDAFSADGIVGLAYQSISDFNAPSLVQNLYAQGLISEPIFGFEYGEGRGVLYIGTPRIVKFNPRSPVYTPVTQQGFWQVVLEAVSVSSERALQDQSAVIDTGTTVVIAPTAAADTVYAAIADSTKLGNGFYTLPCSSIPTVSLTFAGQLFEISPDLFNLGEVSGDASRCFGGIVGTDEVDFWIIGDIFLQGVYTEFDFGNNRVGFAKIG